MALAPLVFGVAPYLHALRMLTWYIVPAVLVEPDSTMKSASTAASFVVLRLAVFVVVEAYLALFHPIAPSRYLVAEYCTLFAVALKSLVAASQGLLEI